MGCDRALVFAMQCLVYQGDWTVPIEKSSMLMFCYIHQTVGLIYRPLKSPRFNFASAIFGYLSAGGCRPRVDPV